MSVGDTDERVGSVAAVVSDDEGADAGGIGLKGERHQVVHQPDMLLIIRGNTGGTLGARHEGDGFLRSFDALLEFPDGGEVFVEFPAVGGTELGF